MMMNRKDKKFTGSVRQTEREAKDLLNIPFLLVLSFSELQIFFFFFKLERDDVRAREVPGEHLHFSSSSSSRFTSETSN